MKFLVSGKTYLSISTVVEAPTAEEARVIAQGRAMQFLPVDDGDIYSAWCHRGDLDGEANIHQAVPLPASTYVPPQAVNPS